MELATATFRGVTPASKESQQQANSVPTLADLRKDSQNFEPVRSCLKLEMTWRTIRDPMPQCDVRTLELTASLWTVTLVSVDYGFCAFSATMKQAVPME